MIDPVPAAAPPPPEPPRFRLVSALLHVLGAALAGFVLMRAMWIDDYVTVAVMVLAFGCNLYLLWEAFRDRQ